MKILKKLKENSDEKFWLALALQPLADMGKDYVNTIKPYKTGFKGWHFLRDCLQPLLGAGKVALAFLLAATSILFLTGTFIKNTFTPDEFKHNMTRNLKLSGIMMVAALTLALRGATQVLTTPLTWVLRIPLRSILTKNKHGKLEKLEETKGFKRDLAALDQAIKDNNESDAALASIALSYKYQMASLKGVATGIDSDEFDKKFGALSVRGENNEPIEDIAKLEGIPTLDQALKFQHQMQHAKIKTNKELRQLYGFFKSAVDAAEAPVAKHVSGLNNRSSIA